MTAKKLARHGQKKGELQEMATCVTTPRDVRPIEYRVHDTDLMKGVILKCLLKYFFKRLYFAFK